VTRGAATSDHSLQMALTVYGSAGSRTPLIWWYLYEQNIPFTQRDSGARTPFGQIPFATDDNNIEIFESGAILLYAADCYGGNNTPQKRAEYTKWVVWANSELDGLCFGKRMSGTSIDKPGRAMDVLEETLSKNQWLVDNKFSVADVAVGSYLNYVPLFFSNVNMASRPNVARYMNECASRPTFAKAFGEQHAEAIKSKATAWMGGKKKTFPFL